MKYHITLTTVLLSLAKFASSACVSGNYRCASPSGTSSQFLQCANGTEFQMSCGPGTVCYTQGTSIMCGYPVDTTKGPPPADKGLVAGAQCQAATPWDEYMCPGDNGLHSYFLRCVSGNYIHFDCPSGTACIKNPGGNLYCGWKSDGGASSAPPPAVSSEGSSTPAASSTAATETTPATLPSETTPPTQTTPSESLPYSTAATGSSTSNPFSDIYPPPVSSSTATSEATSLSTSDTLTDILSPTTAADTATTSSEVYSTLPTSSPTPTPDTIAGKFGISGQMISQGLQMVLANGVSLPMPLPNIDLPAIDLASVHLPDVTLQGIAVTGLHLPTITIPPLNPASLTKFDYIQGILSKAGMSFDDIANLPLPDLASISLSGLGNMNVGNIMGMMGGVGAIGRNEDSNNKPADAPANADEPQTTTLGPDEIDNLLGLSVITYASSA